MHIGIVTLFPEMLASLSAGGVVARALKQQILQLTCLNPRNFSQNKHRRVDDRPFGGGPGMLMQTAPLEACLQQAKAAMGQDTPVIFLSPQGQPLNQSVLAQWLKHNRLILLAGRYEGIDERLLNRWVDAECSIGDYVLSGGELAAMVVIDALARLLPKTLGHPDSASQDSFYQGLLDCPHYTRPADSQVPAVLLSGDHAAIDRWRTQQALGHTWLRRPDLLQQPLLTAQKKQLLAAFIQQWWSTTRQDFYNSKTGNTDEYYSRIGTRTNDPRSP
jgi:tRNA (guanine37-N1)-methyltransferase